MSNTTPEAPLVSVSNVARQLGVTPRTVHRLIEKGSLPAYRLGDKTIRIRQQDIDALLQPIAAGGAS